MTLRYYCGFILMIAMFQLILLASKKEVKEMENQSIKAYRYYHEPECDCAKQGSSNLHNRRILQSLVTSSKIPHNISTLDLLYLENVTAKRKILRMQAHIMKTNRRPTGFNYLFNVTKSDDTPIDRDIPDSRPKLCLDHKYDLRNLQTVSVIIPFYNEAISMLLRTIHSVLRRTPNILLHEIILVDDKSSHDSLLKPLEDYVKLLPKVKLIRNKHRQGLVRSRLYGSHFASAPVLVFLDAHTECNKGWLEPVLAQLQQSPESIVQSFVDGINEENLQYDSPTYIFRGAFTWDLRYVWLMTPAHIQESIKRGQPYFTPVLIGCVIAVTRQYFTHIGEFDSGQMIWGGENIELSFRTWMCGGEIITLPCSRVGHLFKDVPYRHEINWQAQLQKNYMRVAEVWMDDYKKYFYWSTRVYKSCRVNLTKQQWKSLEERKQLKQKLKCKSFQWYLDNVIPEVTIPHTDSLQQGEITNYKSQACWQVLPDSYIGITYECFLHRLIPQNMFTLDENGLLRYKDKCVRLMVPSPALKLDWCPTTENILSFSKWSISYSENNNVYTSLKVAVAMDGIVTTWCIAHVTSIVEPHKRSQMPQAAQCMDDNYFQYWSFTYRFDYKN